MFWLEWLEWVNRRQIIITKERSLTYFSTSLVPRFWLLLVFNVTVKCFQVTDFMRFFTTQQIQVPRWRTYAATSDKYADCKIETAQWNNENIFQVKIDLEMKTQSAVFTVWIAEMSSIVAFYQGFLSLSKIICVFVYVLRSVWTNSKTESIIWRDLKTQIYFCGVWYKTVMFMKQYVWFK